MVLNTTDLGQIAPLASPRVTMDLTRPYASILCVFFKERKNIQNFALSSWCCKADIKLWRWDYGFEVLKVNKRKNTMSLMVYGKRESMPFQ
jgi:hypothetical protein